MPPSPCYWVPEADGDSARYNSPRLLPTIPGQANARARTDAPDVTFSALGPESACHIGRPGRSGRTATLGAPEQGPVPGTSRVTGAHQVEPAGIEPATSCL